MRMSPTLNRSSALERFKRSSAIEIHNRIMLDFYPGLPHILNLPLSFTIHVQTSVLWECVDVSAS